MDEKEGELMPYAVETRNPGNWDEITDAVVEEAIATAERGLNWIRKAIGV